MSQYILRAPLSLEKIVWEKKTDTVVWKASKKGPHKGKEKERYFSSPDFIAQLTLHIPPKGKHLVRRYGVYSSRSRGTWKKRRALMLRASENWYGFLTIARPCGDKNDESETITAKAGRKSWAKLLAKVYEIDVLRCPQCGRRMIIIAVIRDPESIGEIISCMENKGRGPPQTRQSILPPASL